VRLLRFGQKSELGRILGREAYSVLAITDRRFSEKIEDMIKSLNHDFKEDC